MARRVVQRIELGRRVPRTAEAEIDDLGAVVDRVHDRGGLVDVREDTVGLARLDDEQLCIAAKACDSLAVRRRAGGQGRDERPVTVRIGDVARVRQDAVGGRGLRSEIGRCYVGACVHDRNRDPARRAQNRRRHRILPHARELPLVRPARYGLRHQCRLGERAARDKAVDRPCAGSASDDGGKA